MEGEGKAYIENGKLILEPLYFPLMDSLMKAKVISEDNIMSEYNPYLYAAMKAKYGKDIGRYFLQGKEDIHRRALQCLEPENKDSRKLRYRI